MAKLSENAPAHDAEQQMRLIERRLARSEAARAEAEQLLESKSRSLTQAQEQLRQKEVELLEHVNRQTLSHVSAQNLANVATFYGDENQKFIGSDNFASVIGSKKPVTSFMQFAAMVHPHDKANATEILIAASEGRLVDENVRAIFAFAMTMARSAGCDGRLHSEGHRTVSASSALAPFAISPRIVRPSGRNRSCGN
jgi:hypothetical protein